MGGIDLPPKDVERAILEQPAVLAQFVAQKLLLRLLQLGPGIVNAPADLGSKDSGDA